MKRVYIIMGLLGVLGMIAAGIVFFSPQYRVAYYASQLERELKEHPATVLMQVAFPEKADRAALARAAAQVWLDHGYAAAVYRMELTVLHRATPMVAKSIPYASHDAVTAYMRQTQQALERLADVDPASCGVLTGHAPEGGVQDINMALIGVMSEEQKRRYFAALTDIIVSARRNPHHIRMQLTQIYDFIRSATEDAVARMGEERAAQSLGEAPERPYDPCLIQSYILQNLLKVDEAYRTDVFKVQMLRGTAKRMKNALPPANPTGVPPGDKAPQIQP